MIEEKIIKKALISVYYKDGLLPLAQKLNEMGVEIFSTGGTQSFLEENQIPVTRVEDLTSYPSILGGRVKTLHPKVFGGILSRRNLKEDQEQLKTYEIPEIDLVIVDLYPFEETVRSGASESAIIEKIDIGGISLIRAAAKNFQDVVIISNKNQYQSLLEILNSQNGGTTLSQRKNFSKEAFHISSHYDSAIYQYFAKDDEQTYLKLSQTQNQPLRYGENPHQKGTFHGNLNELFEQLNGKELSYNNLLDIDAAVSLINDFDKKIPTFAILKHNNACGIACKTTIFEAWRTAYETDTLSAFGGVLIANQTIDEITANDINQLFFEVIIAPNFDKEALSILSSKKNRIILQQKPTTFPNKLYRSALNGILEQERDAIIENDNHLTVVTTKKPAENEIKDLLFANKIVKHTKSNTIVLAKNNQLIASGTGQTSRVDALKQAIEKANSFGFDLKGAVMASDAFFPFPDCVEIAYKSGISAVIQPGGSIKDQDSIDFCNKHQLSMVTTGIRHFKH
jgi:phosphoribosylaminoimidazolecarboxamide formyltransferase / IMP cyclohydrolase